MGDVERITTTERHAERERIAQAAYEAFAVASASKIGQLPPFDSIGPAKQDWLAVADAVLPFIERGRVRVVEGLVATIKARRAESLVTRDDMTLADSVGWAAAQAVATLDWVLAVVEAAREDTT